MSRLAESAIRKGLIMHHHNLGDGGEWRRIMALVVMALSMTAAARCPAADATTPAGGLTCLEPLFRFGDLGPEQRVRHTFVLTNTSDRAVQIGAVRAGCGCLTAELATNSVAPGGTVELSATMNLAGRKGAQRKTVYVESGAGVNAPLRLEFEGNVVPPIAVMPEGIHFGAQAAEGEIEQSVMVTAMGSALFQIKGVTSSSSRFAAEVETVEAGKRYRLKVKCGGPRTLGTCTASIRVATDHPAMPAIDVPVTVFVAGDIVAAPAVVMVIESATNTPRTYYVHVYSPGKKAFKIEKVTVPRADIEARVTDVTPDRHRVELSLPGQVRDLNGTSLRIDTDMASMKEVVVPFRVIARPGK